MSDVIHYKPGTPEFEEISKQITHISKVKGELKSIVSQISAEQGPFKSFRHENIEKV